MDSQSNGIGGDLSGCHALRSLLLKQWGLAESLMRSDFRRVAEIAVSMATVESLRKPIIRTLDYLKGIAVIAPPGVHG